MTSSHPLKILSPCPYFHACGGCDFLDLSEESYRHLKKQSLEKYLINLGLEPRWLWVGVNSRRKINLQISDKNVVGFFSEKSNSIVEIEKCLTAEKEISELILPLKNFFKSQEQNLFTQVSITLFDSGPDLIFSSKKPLNFSQTQKLTTFAKEKNFNISSRVKNDISPIFLVRKNQIFYHDFNPDPSLEFKKNFAKREQLEGNFASRTVSVPRYVRNAEVQNSLPDAALSRNFAEENLHENVPVSKMASKPTGSDSGENQIRSNDGSGLNPKFKINLDSDIFIQATKSGLESITKIIREFLEKENWVKNVADIYSGFGAYSFAIQDLVKSVSAFEGDEKMVTSLNKNAAANNFGNKIKAETRDVFSDPLRAKELNKFDLVIVNPPRNGASPQISEISKSSLKNLIYVSCNPESFARDSKILTDNGFKITNLTALDQFYSTKHLELIAIFQKN